MALKERTHRAVRSERGKDHYNQKTYGLKFKKTNTQKPRKKKKSKTHKKRTLDIPEDMWKVNSSGKLVRNWKV
jgi:hypothetical protein